MPMTRKKGFMESVVDEHGDDFVIRLFAANKSLAHVDRELRKAGYHKDYPTGYKFGGGPRNEARRTKISTPLPVPPGFSRVAGSLVGS